MPENQQPDAKQVSDEQVTSQQSSGWKVDSSLAAPMGVTEQQTDFHPVESVEWSASEYVHHEKTAIWYVLLIAISIPVIIGIYFFTGKDIVAVVASVIIVALFGASASRAPRSLNYKVDADGITIGNRHFLFSAFKSFSIVEENALQTVVLSPMRRFVPPLSVYCPPNEIDNIVDALSLHLPFEPRQADPIDTIMRKLRF